MGGGDGTFSWCQVYQICREWLSEGTMAVVRNKSNPSQRVDYLSMSMHRLHRHIFAAKTRRRNLTMRWKGDHCSAVQLKSEVSDSGTSHMQRIRTVSRKPYCTGQKSFKYRYSRVYRETIAWKCGQPLHYCLSARRTDTRSARKIPGDIVRNSGKHSGK